jgi:hypothetical protein
MAPTDFIALVSGLTGVITAVGVLIVNIMQNKKTSYLLEYRMKNVEQKLDEHNNYASRFEEIEKAIVAMQKDVEFLRTKMEE